MSNRFAKQYNLLGLEAPSADIDPREKAEIIFYAACKKQGFDPSALPQVHHLPEAFQVFPVVAYKLEVITIAIRDGRKLDWNSRQKKWSPWFWLDSPGFRFLAAGYALTGTASGGGPRLCSAENDDADFIAIECIALWADFCDNQLPA